MTIARSFFAVVFPLSIMILSIGLALPAVGMH
ncbi:protein of unknown function [Pseudodesulfovibrio profundus]|uniref:Uncharacterized protein n=1 Tax=Pseudodesulfovibrio profundus TaxID=57320 RepID=A0A2C8F8D9_9BACT|nr:protein of unknown function [Pseudodesulfovibrio profundus]